MEARLPFYIVPGVYQVACVTVFEDQFSYMGTLPTYAQPTQYTGSFSLHHCATVSQSGWDFRAPTLDPKIQHPSFVLLTFLQHRAEYLWASHTYYEQVSAIYSQTKPFTLLFDSGQCKTEH
jgi:hypothetical protein